VQLTAGGPMPPPDLPPPDTPPHNFITPASFATAMQAFTPFESKPAIAVAVSGGPDSLALLLLIDDWVRARGGSALALTVDHGLRPDSADEAAQVGEWARARGIAHETLRWTGDKPRSGIQAVARQARYALLIDACALRGILHLAFAHHADDQAETVLFRRERGSGVAGLAGMAASRSLGATRLIRPLLGWPKSALTVTCRHFGQVFFEDPSNRSDRFARAVLRRRLADDPERRGALLREAAEAASLRVAADMRLAKALAAIVEIRPDGIALFDRAAFAAAGADMRHAVLAATLRTVGGQAFAPTTDAVGRLDCAVLGEDFAGASLGGCVVRLWGGRVLVCREPKRAAPPVALVSGEWSRWDDRFSFRVAGHCGDVTVGALGNPAYAKLRHTRNLSLPAIAGAGLPATKSTGRLVAVPSAGWAVDDFPAIEERFSPLWPLSSETFTVVYAGPDIMSA
jgi:tRNA(Ile)-lysidine synthase